MTSKEPEYLMVSDTSEEPWKPEGSEEPAESDAEWPTGRDLQWWKDLTKNEYGFFDDAAELQADKGRLGHCFEAFMALPNARVMGPLEQIPPVKVSSIDSLLWFFEYFLSVMTTVDITELQDVNEIQEEVKMTIRSTCDIVLAFEPGPNALSLIEIMKSCGATSRKDDIDIAKVASQDYPGSGPNDLDETQCRLLNALRVYLRVYLYRAYIHQPPVTVSAKTPTTFNDLPAAVKTQVRDKIKHILVDV